VLAAMEELSALGTVDARSPVIASAPIGAAPRIFANAVAQLETDLAPPALLRELKRFERDFGRRPGKTWGDRVLDLDIVLWSGGRWHSRRLHIPHRGLAARSFVLGPATAIAPGWRDPDSGLTLRQLQARLTRPQALPRERTRSDP